MPSSIPFILHTSYVESEWCDRYTIAGIIVNSNTIFPCRKTYRRFKKQASLTAEFFFFNFQSFKPFSVSTFLPSEPMAYEMR